MPYQVSMMGWVGSGEDFCGLGWVLKKWPMTNSGLPEKPIRPNIAGRLPKKCLHKKQTNMHTTLCGGGLITNIILWRLTRCSQHLGRTALRHTGDVVIMFRGPKSAVSFTPIVADGHHRHHHIYFAINWIHSDNRIRVVITQHGR